MSAANNLDEAMAAGRPIKDRLAEHVPVVLVLTVMAVALPLVGGTSSWITLTLAALAMGMMIFLMASGLSLIFGLMDVLNFGHGAFITVGAFVTASALIPLAGWVDADSVVLNLLALIIVSGLALAVGAGLGYLFERVIIRPVYGDHLRQILITMGALIVAEELIPVIWGPQPVNVPMPKMLQGVFVFGDVAFEKFRLVAVVVGVAVFVALRSVLTRSRIGLLVRAGVENRAMVEALGYPVNALFIAVFMAGSALAAFGGVLWALYQGVITARVGAEVLILVFIVVIIGGLGSVRGSLVGALLVGLTANYVGYIAPKLALGSNILLMVLILLWRPTGLYPPTKV